MGFQHNYFTGKLIFYKEKTIETHLKEYIVSFGVPLEKVEIVFSNLLYCSLPSVYEQEQLDIQSIIDSIRESGKDTAQTKDGMAFDVKEKIRDTYEKYKYLHYHGYRNHSLNMGYYYSLIEECIAQNRDYYNPIIKEQQRVLFDTNFRLNALI